MGTVKFEVDIPDFENEISITVTIKKEGEVICTTSSSSSSTDIVEEPKKRNVKKKNEEKKTEVNSGTKKLDEEPILKVGGTTNKVKSKSSNSSIPGNMMDYNF